MTGPIYAAVNIVLYLMLLLSCQRVDGHYQLPISVSIVVHRLRDVRDTCCLSAMSINIRKKRQPVIWSVQHLPSDSTGVMAVPRGGVLVLSQNLLLYYAQVGIRCRYHLYDDGQPS